MSGSPGIVNQTPRSIRSIHCRQFYTPKSNVFFYSFYSFYSYARQRQHHTPTLRSLEPYYYYLHIYIFVDIIVY